MKSGWEQRLACNGKGAVAAAGISRSEDAGFDGGGAGGSSGRGVFYVVAGKGEGERHRHSELGKCRQGAKGRSRRVKIIGDWSEEHEKCFDV